MLRELSDPEKMALVVRGRALVRMIEAAKVLLTSATTLNERVTYGLARDLARQALRELVRDLEPAITVQILMASERVWGTVKVVMLN
jgi:hypothetical protein